MRVPFILFITLCCVSLWLTSETNAQNLQFQYREFNAVDNTYSDPVNFRTNQISSDYGIRDCPDCTTNFHDGIDFSPVLQEADYGYHILSIVSGTVQRIQAGNGFKVIWIEGEGDNPDFGYGHIFTDGVITNGMVAGNFVLKTLDSPYQDFAAIIFFPTSSNPVAISTAQQINPEDPAPTVTYNNNTYQTTNTVTAGQSIAPYGRSGGTNVHLLDQNTRIEELDRKLEGK